MKKILIVLALLFPATAFADTCAKGLMPLFTAAQATKLCSYFSAGTIGVIANNTFAVARNAANSGNLNIWKADGSDNTHLNAKTGKVIDLDINVTPVAAISSAGLVFQQSTAGLTYFPAVITPATNLTPVAGSNDVPPLGIIVTAGPTNQAVALNASPADGEERAVLNLSGQPLIVAALGTPSMNFPVTPGPRRLSVAARSKATCIYSASALSWGCTLASAYATPAS